MTRPGWNPPGPEREIGRGVWRDDQLERRVLLYGPYAIKLYPDPGHPVAIEDPTLAIVQAGDEQFWFPIEIDLAGSELVWAEAGVSVPGSADLEIMIRNGATDMLSTPITIPAGQRTSFATGDSSVIDPAAAKVALADDIWIDIVTDGGGDAAGLIIAPHFA